MLALELAKKPCQHFYKTGSCSFENTCRFSHMTPERRAALEKQVEEGKRAARNAMKVKEKFNPTIEIWLAKRDRKDNTKKGKDDTSILTKKEYQLPEFLQGIPNLPPSILPPTYLDIEQAALEEGWG